MTTPNPASAATPISPARREIKLISHSMLFYWWPIWVCGYLLAAITYFDGTRLAIVPDGSKLTRLESESDDKTIVYRLAVPARNTRSLEQAESATKNPGEGPPFKPRTSERSWMGPIFCVVLLLVILITNVPMRGLWSFLVLLTLALIALIITLIPGGWDSVLSAIFHLHIYINLAGYLFVATSVFLMWLISTFIFDSRTYIIVTPGQIRVCEHIGASVRTFDTMGISFEKQRDDLFRHWLLGFFSGDLIVRTAGAERETIRMPNVLWISWRLEEVQDMLREKATVSSV
jgi:hypothetical protein